MSFTAEVKEEIVRIELNENNRKAQLSGVIQLLSSLSISSKGLSLNIKTTMASLAKMISLDLKSLYGVGCELTAVKQNNLNKLNVYTLTLSEKVKEILADLDLWTERGLQDHPRLLFLKNDDMIKSYLTGCFLATGSINSPRTTSYHMEIKTNAESHATFLIHLLEKFYISAKTTVRRERHVVYVKRGSEIADFLKLMNCQAVMDYEEIRIQRDFMNNLYRLDNIKIANEQKSQAVSDKQIEALTYLKENNLLKYLSQKDCLVGELRLNNPDASLSELSELYEDQTGEMLSKSGIRHRFDKIFALVDKYRKKEEERDEK